MLIKYRKNNGLYVGNVEGLNEEDVASYTVNDHHLIVHLKSGQIVDVDLLKNNVEFKLAGQ